MVPEKDVGDMFPDVVSGDYEVASGEPEVTIGDLAVASGVPEVASSSTQELDSEDEKGICFSCI